MKNFFKSLVLSNAISLVLIGVLSLIMSNTNINDSLLYPIIIGIATFSILIGGFCIAKNKKEKGIIFGSLVGIVYILCLYILSSIILLDFSLTINSLIFIVLGILGGAVGGILGVNF